MRRPLSPLLAHLLSSLLMAGAGFHDAPLSPAEEEALAGAIRRGQPFGAPDWRADTAARLGLGST
jgi:hypothetical protein